MTRQTKSQKKIDKPSGRSALGGIIVRHKRILTIIGIVALIPALITLINRTSYQDKFSDKDYAAIVTSAETVFRSVGAENVIKHESCRHRAPGKYEEKRLYCGVDMAAYLPYESDEQAAELAKRLEKSITSHFGMPSRDFSSFYEKPYNGYSYTTIPLNGPLHEEQCNFYIQSNEKAKRAVYFLPEKTADNLIALRFECSGESREEYFPVTDR